MSRPGRKCRVCQSKSRLKIEQCIIDAKVSIRAIERRFNISRRSVTNHRDKCMRPALAKIVQDAENDTRAQTHEAAIKINRQVRCIQDFIDRIEHQYGELGDILQEARREGETYDIRAAILAIREMRESLRLYLDLHRETRISEKESKEKEAQNFDITIKAVMEVLAGYPEASAAVIARMEEMERERA